MEAYNSSVLDMKSLGLFTDYARIEGEKKGEKRGEKKGEKRGRVEGKREAYTQIVLNAANEGMSIEDIARITNLPLEQIRDILKKKK
jgi:predicted transposase/invertase (TIGR01784 family)